MSSTPPQDRDRKPGKHAAQDAPTPGEEVSFHVSRVAEAGVVCIILACLAWIVYEVSTTLTPIQQEMTAEQKKAEQDKDILWAAANGDARKVAELLEGGADVNAREDDGRTALHEAVGNNPQDSATAVAHAETVRVLLEHGANATAATNRGATPLHWAARWGQTQAASLLLEHGADVNAKDADKQTPLHKAAMHGENTMVKLLMEHGADPAAEDADGDTPLRTAELQGNADAAAILRGEGA